MGDVQGHGGRDVGNPEVRLIDEGAVLVRRQEGVARQAPQLGIGQPLGHEHVRAVARLEQQPAGGRVQEVLELDERAAAVLFARHEHVHRTAGDEPQGIGIVEANGPVAASDERRAARQGEVRQPFGGSGGSGVRASQAGGKGLPSGGFGHHDSASMSRRYRPPASSISS